MRRNWKRVQPSSLRDAMDLCLEYAREKHNQSIDNIADTMGLASKWTLYKWVQEANLPSRMIRPFEHACGIHLVSRWLAVSSGKLVIDFPRGKLASPEDIHTLQEVTHDAIGALIKFYADQADTVETLAAVQTALERLAWHKINVEKSHQPELPFDEE
ncbi:hypothetical protein [Methylomicrobium sp. Wu6]|uniref:hypothetical protein n=1 Tax=Methylomicrobium sp. Wu6 TaxID=3107928 RepID=UPI002DD62D89|nr:hypothetical protein [Methylomicrobium sp. Wu6]MEC4750032.1 hypothetical protein [Methylomicrobium sp. Wu6]